MEMNKHVENNSNAGRLRVHNSIPCYSEREAKALEERLSNKETFGEAVQVLNSWLQNGKCNKSNCLQFYALIQKCSDYKEKLQNEQKECFDKAQKAQESLRNASSCNERQLNEFEGLLEATIKPNILNNFTEDQIKKIREMVEDVQSENVAKNQKDTEAKIISLVSCILCHNLDGLNIEGISTQLQTTSEEEIEAVLRKHPKIFKESEEKKWSLTISRENLASLMGK